MKDQVSLCWIEVNPFGSPFQDYSLHNLSNVKLPAHRAGLPGHAVASRMRANESSIVIVPLDSAYKTGFAGYLPVN